MAAGLGFKTFTTGEVLTASDVNGYLMQGVLVFASAAARNAAITSPQEGQFAFTKDTNSLWYYDGAAWVASGATGDIEGVTAGVGISGGGTSGTVTVTNDMATTITAAGDIVVGTGSGTYDNLPIGTTAQVLTADTTVSPYKVKWATPSAGMTNPMTTTGDTIYSSSGSTPARLGIGTTGQVLTVSSGVPSWATPAAAGGMTLIGTSSLSGASVTISSIPNTYKHLMILVERAYSVSSDYPIALRFSGDTSANYNNKTIYGQAEVNGYAEYRNDTVNGTSMEIRTRTITSVTAGKNLNLVLNVYNYASTDPRFLQGSAYSMNSGNEVVTTQTAGTYKGTSAISSVTALIPGTTWSGGTFSVYGVS